MNQFNHHDTKACELINHAEFMCDAAIEAMDMKVAKRYASIILRIIKYRFNLLERFLLEDIV